MHRIHLAKSLSGVIALVALTSTVSDNAIRFASAEAIDFIHAKIRDVNSAVSRVVGVTTPVARIHSTPKATDLAFLSRSTGLTESLATINLQGFGVFQTVEANSPQRGFSTTGAYVFETPQTSHTGGESGAGTVLVNSGIGSGGPLGPAMTSSGAPLPSMLPGITGPHIPSYRPAVPTINPVVAKTLRDKNCTSGVTTAPDAVTKVVLAAGDCSTVGAADMTKQTLVGHTPEILDAGGQFFTSPHTANATITTDLIPLDLSMNKFGDYMNIAPYALGIELPIGEFAANFGTDLTTIAISPLLPTPVPSPHSLALLGLGLGCMSWVLYRRKFV